MVTDKNIADAIAKIVAVARNISSRATAAKPLTTLLKADKDSLVAQVKVLSGIDVTTFLKGLYTPTPSVPADTTAPTDPSSLSVTLVSNKPSLTWTASTDAVGVAYYHVYRKVGAGSYGSTPYDIAPSNSYVDQNASALGSLHTYKVLAYDAAGNFSGFSNESSATPVAGNTPDVTAPPVPSQPSVAVVDDAANTYSTTWPTVIDPVVGGAVTSNMRRYRVYESGVFKAYVDQPSGPISSEAATPIGSGTGSDSGTVITSTGTAQHYGTADDFYLKSAPVSGDFDVSLDLTAISGPFVWGKAGLEARGSSDRQSQYFNGFAFAGGSGNGLNSEYRATIGAQAAQATAAAQTAPVKLRLTRAGNLFTAYYALNLVTPVWVVLGQQTIAMPSIVYVGRFADNETTSGTLSGTYANYSLTGASPALYNGTGTDGASFSVTVASEDNAGNVSAQSTGRTVTFAGAAPSADQYPKSGAILFGGGFDQQVIPVANRAAIAKRKAVIIGGNPENVYDFVGYTREQLVQDMKSRATANGITQKVLQYVMYYSVALSRTSNYSFTWWDQVAANNWKVYQSGASGTLAGDITGAGFFPCNLTAAAGTDSNGRRTMQAAAKHCFDYFNSTTYTPTGMAPSLDGYMLDNCNIYYSLATTNADWNRDGSADSFTGAVNASIRQGHVDFWQSGQALAPTKYWGGNAADWGQNNLYLGSVTALSPINGVPSLAFAEHALGGPWGGTNHTIEYYYGALGALKYLQFTEDALTSTGIMLVCHDALSATGTDELSATSWKSARHGLGMVTVGTSKGYWSAIQNSGQSGSSATQYTSTNIYDYDELHGGNLNDSNWYGDAVDGRQTSAWLRNIYRRRFTKGTVYWVPRGTGAASMTPAEMGGSGLERRLTGTQDATVNSGALITSTVNIADGDSLFTKLVSVYG